MKVKSTIKTLQAALFLGASLFSFEAYSYSAAGAQNGQDHFSQNDCTGCHGNASPLTNFMSIQAGPPNMLMPNTVYTIRINAASMMGGRDAYKLQVYNTSSGTSLGTLLDGPAGNPIQDVISQARRKQGTKIADTTNGTDTFREYFWRSPAGPNELPASVTISGTFMDGTGNGNGGEPHGQQQIVLQNPNAGQGGGSEDEDLDNDISDDDSTSSTHNSATGFSDLSSGCGVMNANASGSFAVIFSLLMAAAMAILMRRHNANSRK